MEKRKRKRNIIKAFLIFLVLVIAIRVALPYVVLHYANKSLAGMDGYYGHIEDIDLALIRGAYKIDSIYLNKTDSVSGRQTPFVSASVIDLSIEWKSLLKGSIVSKIEVDRPVLIFTKDRVEPGQVIKDSADFRKVLNDFMPLDINRFEVRNGELRFRDQTSTPPVDIRMNQLHVLAQNLRNSYDSSAVLPATLDASASVYEGRFVLKAKMNPLAVDPTFDLSAELNNTNLVQLNDFFKAYAKVDVNSGRFGLYTEIAAKNSKFAGYVKPIIKDLDVLGHEDRRDNFFQKIWEGLVGTVGEVLQNQKKDQQATKIPFQGRLDNPRTNTWVAVVSILQNAFIRAIQPSIDNEINIGSVHTDSSEKKTFLQKIFKGKGGDKKR